MRLAKVLLYVMATTFIAFGVAYACWPASMVRDVGVRLTTAAARIDLAAVYGGLQVGIGVFLCFCALSPQRVRTGLVATLAMLAGLSGTRAIGMLETGEHSLAMWSLLAVEALGVPLSVVGLAALKRSGRHSDADG